MYWFEGSISLGLDMLKRTKSSATVLLLSERRTSALKRHLVKSGYEVMETFTTDHAVAVCVNNDILAVVLDQSCFVETDGWSVAQSLKASSKEICILLVMRGRQIKSKMPKGVDAIVSDNDLDEVVAQLERFAARVSGVGARSRYAGASRRNLIARRA